MKINLIRNLNTQRNKEQEDSFENTMNLALYFNINPKIEKVDGWKLSNIKRLVIALGSTESEIDIEFSRWNESVEYIFSNLKINLIQHQQTPEKILISIRNRAYSDIYNYMKEIKDDKNLKLELLLSIAEELKGNPNSIMIINEFINNGISTIDIAIDTIIPLLFIDNKVEGK